MTSFPLYPHSYSINPFIHHQNIHRIHQNNSYHHHYLIYLVSRSTHLGTRYLLYIILYSTSFISMTSFPLYPYSCGIIPSFITKAFTAFTRITRIISIISFILFQDLHILKQDIHSISYFTQHHSFQWHHSLYINTHTVSFHSSPKHSPAFTRITRIITIISFILFQDLHILEQDLHFISYFIHHSFIIIPFIHTLISINPFIHHQNIHRIQNNSYHHHLIHLVSRSTHLGPRYPLYMLFYSTSFISMTSFPLYPHSYSIIPSIHHQNIHRIHQNNSNHHHYLIYLVSRSTHLGTRYPLYIILYSTSFISMTSFTVYPHSYSVIPFIHHQNIPCIHLNN